MIIDQESNKFKQFLSYLNWLLLVLYLDKIPWHVANRAVDKVAKTLGYHKPVYAVVLDAGSTGSRVLAFTFHESYLGILYKTYTLYIYTAYYQFYHFVVSFKHIFYFRWKSNLRQGTI